jgi:hypothetical protein
MEKIHYNYIYTDPTKPGPFKYSGLEMTFDFRPFYVGKGKDERCYRHIGEARDYHDKNIYKCNTIRKIIREGYDMKKYILFYDRDISEAKSIKQEISLIALIGRHEGPLTNMTDGGEGTSGHKQSKEQKDKTRKTKIKRDSYKISSEKMVATKKRRGTAKLGGQNSARTKKRRGTAARFLGPKSNLACKFLITEPDSTQHILHGTYFKWLEEHRNISGALLAKWMDKGPISEVHYKKNKNMLGWSVQHIN